MIFRKKRLCSSCLTGKESYALDPQSITCPHIDCYKKNKCSFYKPLNKNKSKTFSLFARK